MQSSIFVVSGPGQATFQVPRFSLQIDSGGKWKSVFAQNIQYEDHCSRHRFNDNRRMDRPLSD